MEVKLRPKVSLTISPMPPFLGLKVDLPTDLLVAKRLPAALDRQECAHAVARIVETLLADQYTDGEALGAWSKAYPGYLHRVFANDIPADVSVRESITCSSLIARGLFALTGMSPHHELSEAIQIRLDSFVGYLLRHQDERTGGFGIRGKPRTRGGGEVAVDFRHTAWAMLSLLRFGSTSSDIATRLSRAAAFLQTELKQLGEGERAITYAVLHRLLTTEVVGPLVLPIDTKRRATIKKLEAQLVASYDARFGSWDTDRDPPNEAAIDNALFVLQSVEIASCIDPECAEVFRSSYEKLMRYMKGPALPFELGGRPDIGTTAAFVFLLARNQRQLGVSQSDINRVAEYVINQAARPGASLGYPWHVSEFLRLAAGDT